MKSYITTQDLNFKEPKDPPIPNKIARAEKHFLEGATMRLSKEEKKKEQAMNVARKKLEIVNFEDRLHGKAKTKARDRRLAGKKFKSI